MHRTFAMAQFDDKYVTFHLIAIVKFALYRTICEIFGKSGIMRQMFTLKIKVKVKKNAIFAIRIEMLNSK